MAGFYESLSEVGPGKTRDCHVRSKYGRCLVRQDNEQDIRTPHLGERGYSVHNKAFLGRDGWAADKLEAALAKEEERDG